MQQLLKEYRQSLKSAKELKERVPEEERKIVTGIITDIEYAIQWMQTGRMPGNTKGIEKQDAYKNSMYWDSSMGVYICKSAFNDPFEEVDKRIDAERRKAKHA